MNNKNSFLFCVSIVFCTWIRFAIVYGSDKPYNFEIHQFTPSAEYNKDWLDWNMLRIKKVARNQYVITGDFIANMNIGNEQKVVLQAFGYNRHFEKRGPMVFTQSFPYCEIYEKLSDIYENLKKFTNIPSDEPCPLPKGTYTFNNFILEATFLPNTTPKGDYLLNVLLFNAEKPVAGFTAEVSIT